ncbi:membrane protein, putative [Babesia bigemina]|uniref:Membrane protein, putative n=1 Tax=Babesia bigemina TaxID=5866 RepID=A0A061D9H9_BABBI|nr:membrane protein, putative [Babesia bigemina]CDR97321.1 membrane protein, putative [Babesia bigemina]|eukprot:XP_012769507.1 membrane protein, putative [Babesia bigemina]
MERALRNFIIILAIDITVFVASVVIWCSKRTKIIVLIQNSLQGLHLLNRKKQKEHTQSDNRRVTVDDVKYRVTYQSGYASSVTEADNDGSSSAENGDEDSSNEASAATLMYIERKKKKPSAEGGRATSSKKRKDTWWYYLYHGKHNKIRNNEAVLYLGFIRSTCIMLLICSAVAIVSNVVIFTHLTVNNKPHFLLTYSIEDLRTCKVTVWTLYATTWIYSIIVYVHILKFKQKVNKGKQITVMLRPQLHTIMIFGFDKTITDPGRFYRYFEKYFPEHVLSVHVVFNHSKRMALEEELKATKAQLCLCRDMSLLVDRSREAYQHSAVTSTSGKEAVDGRADADVAPKKPRRSRSCGMLPEAEMKCSLGQTAPLRNCASSVNQGGTPRNCASSANLLSLPKPAKPEPKKPSLAIPKGFTRYVTRMLGKNDCELQEAGDAENLEYLGERFAGLLKKVKELKARIEQELNREHTTSARICFVSFADSNIVLHILKDRNLLEGMPTWRIVPAPHPRDIIWQNLHLPRWYVATRMVVCNLLLTIFYIVITWILSHLNLLHTVKSKDDRNPERSFSINDLTERSFWSSIMPPIIMAGLNSFVHPTMINLLSRQVGFWTQTAHQKYLLFGHVKSSTGRSTRCRWSWGPSSSTPRGVRSICIYFFKFDIGVTNFDLGYWYAFHLSILTLVMLFSLFIPYLLILGTLYFAVRYCVDRHNIAYDVLQLPLDSTGKIAASAVKSMLICISLTQFAMSGVFLNCQEVLPSTCITLLYIASVATWLLLYESNADAVVEATESMHKIKLAPLTKKMMDTIKLCYMHPCDAKDLIDGRVTQRNSQ